MKGRWSPGSLSPLLLVLALGGATGPAAAQEAGRDTLGWRGSVEFGLTLTQGNSETTSLSVGLGVARLLERQKWTFDGSIVRATADGDETANKGNASGRYDFFPDTRFFVFGRLAGGYNRPAGVDLRLSPSAGAGYVVVRTGGLVVSTKAGGGFLTERFADDSTANNAFLSLAQDLSLAVNEHTDLTQSASYEPKTEDFGDFLLRAEVALSTTFAPPLGIKIRVIDEFDSSPFVDEEGTRREKNDVTFITGLTLEF